MIYEETAPYTTNLQMKLDFRVSEREKLVCIEDTVNEHGVRM